MSPIKLHITSKSLNEEEWNALVNDDLPFLLLSFNRAFEVSHKSNMTHLFYISNNPEQQLVGYAQALYLNWQNIHSYQQRNKLSRGIISVLMKLTRIKIVAMGNGFLTNIQNVSIKTLNDNIAFLTSLIQTIGNQLNVNNFIFPDHYFNALNISKPEDSNPNFIRVEVEEDMVLYIKQQWKCFDDYSQSLKKKYKTRQRGVMKKSRDVLIKKLTLNDIKLHQNRIQQLFLNVQRKASFGAVSFNTNTFQLLTSLSIPYCNVYGYFLNDILIGFSSEIYDQSKLYSYFIGLDYQYNVSHRLYERILLENINHGIDLGKKEIVFGRTAAEFKSNVGAVPLKSFIYIYVKNPLLRFILNPILSRIKPKKWVQRSPFKQEQT